MSSILVDLARQAEIQPGWVGAAVDKGISEVSKLPTGVQAPLLAGLAELRKGKDVLAESSSRAFVAFAARLSLGDESGAKQIWLRDVATADEREAQLDSDNLATLADTAARAASYEAAKQIALAVLKAAGQAGIALLLAAI